MNSVSHAENVSDVERPPRRWVSKSLRREIIIVLLIKLVLIMGIKMVFFSHPLSKQETQNRLENMLAGSEQTQERPAPKISHSNSTE